MSIVSLLVFLISLFLSIYSSSISTESNYFVDVFEPDTTEYTLYYPYPMDICLQNGIYQYDYLTYTCLDDNSGVTRTKYSDSDCTTATETTTFYTSNIKDNGVYDFNCGGITNYVKVNTCVRLNTNRDDCQSCALTAESYWATDVCHYGGNGTTSRLISSQCDAQKVLVNEYKDQDECSIVTGDIAAGTNCSYYGRLSTDYGKFYVYALMESCVLDDDEQVAGAAVTTPTPTQIIDDSDGNDDSDNDDDDSDSDADNSDGDGDDDDASGTNSGSNGVTSSSDNDGGDVNSTTIIVIVLIIGIILCVLIIFGLFTFLKKKQKLFSNKEVGFGYDDKVHDEMSMTKDGIAMTGASTHGGHNDTNDDIHDHDLHDGDQNENENNENNGNNNENGNEVVYENETQIEIDDNNAALPQQTNDGNQESAIVGES